MIATGIRASASVWSVARQPRLPDDASSCARPWSRDETRESPPWTDTCPRAGKARGVAVVPHLRAALTARSKTSCRRRRGYESRAVPDHSETPDVVSYGFTPLLNGLRVARVGGGRNAHHGGVQ